MYFSVDVHRAFDDYIMPHTPAISLVKGMTVLIHKILLCIKNFLPSKLILKGMKNMDAQAIYTLFRQKENTASRTNDKDELKKTSDALEKAWQRFNYITDPDLIEAEIFEIRALRAKYSYYLRRIKEKES